MPSDRALDRVSRLLDLIPFLRNRPISLKELAHQLNLDEKTLQRDLEIAFLCGLPGYTPDLLIDLTFEDSFITVSNPQSLISPRRISDLERISILLGLDLLETRYVGSEKVTASINSLRKKLHDTSEGMSGYVEADSRLRELVSFTEGSIVERKRISFTYVDAAGNVSVGRDVSPWRLMSRRGQLILRGFDHLKKAARDFVLLRVSDLASRDGDYQQAKEVTLDAAHRGVLRLSSVPMWWRRRNIFLIDGISENGELFEVEIQYWRHGSVIAATLPIVDLFLGFKSDDWSEEEFRDELLSHFRGN